MSVPPQSALSGTLPNGGVVLTVGEVAAQWKVTPAHIINLIEGGQLGALDVSGRLNCFPVPKAALNQLAMRLKVTPEHLFEFLRTFETDGHQKNRCQWRVPVESFNAFTEKRRSLNLTITRK